MILERYTDAAGLAAQRASAHFTEVALGEIIPRLVSRHVYEGTGTQK